MPGGDGDGNVDIPVPTERMEQPVKKFTWKELSKLNSRDNAHVAYRGKVSIIFSSTTDITPTIIYYI